MTTVASLVDTIYVNNGLGFASSIGIPIGTALFIGIFTVVGVFVAAKFAGQRFLKTHDETEKKLLNDFKLTITNSVTAMNGKKVNWPDFESHRRENDNSVRRIHDKMESYVRRINGCMLDVKTNVGEIKGIVLKLQGSFEQHLKLPHG
jgi:hypothetical protein